MAWSCGRNFCAGLHKAIGSCQHVFQLRFHAADGNQLILRRFRAAIPRFAEIGNDTCRMFRSDNGRGGETSRSVRGLPDAFERCPPRFFLAFRRRCNFLNGFTQGIHSRVDVFPGIGQRLRIKRANHSPHVFQFEHSRAFRDQQANAKLNRRYILDEGLLLQHVEQVEIALHSRPWGKRHKCRMKGHAKFAESLDDVQKILACVAFVEEFQNGIVYRLNRADDEETAGIAKRGEMLLIFAQVLDLDRYVVGELREFPVEFLNEFDGMTDAVEEVRIAERDMLRAGSRLAANVFENNIAADDSKDTFVYRHDRTMPATMRCAYFSIAGKPERSGTSKDSLASEIRDSGCRASFCSPPVTRRSARCTSPSSNSPPRIVETPSVRRYSTFIGA